MYKLIRDPCTHLVQPGNTSPSVNDEDTMGTV